MAGAESVTARVPVSDRVTLSFAAAASTVARVMTTSRVMLSDAGAIFTVAWWMMVFPGLFLFATTLAFNLLGDGLRDALDPRMRARVSE